MAEPSIVAMAGDNHIPLDSIPTEILLGICFDMDLESLKNLSLTNHYFRNVTTLEIFRNIKISTGDWDKADEALKVLENCPAAIDSARAFTLVIFTGYDIGPPLPQGLDLRVAKVLKQMPQLRHLKIEIPECSANQFEDAMNLEKVIFPNVKSISLGAFCDFMIAFCPNVERVGNSGGHFIRSTRGERGEAASRLITSASKAPKLVHFETRLWWKLDLLGLIYKSMPQITSLAISGRLPMKFSDTLEVLTRFQKLENLILPGASNLKIGFYPPRCGNAFMGPDGDEVHKRVTRDQEVFSEKAARQSFEGIPSLKTVWVGNWRCYNASRDEYGAIKEMPMVQEKRKTTYGMDD